MRNEKNSEPHPTFEETYTIKRSFVISFLEYQMRKEIRKKNRNNLSGIKDAFLFDARKIN